jgi:acetolactate synthase-1/2/3 large subunit
MDTQVRPPTYNVQDIIHIIEQAKRPVLFVGNGVRLAGAEQELKKAIAQLCIPILTTWRAADMIPDDHPYAMGRPGMIGQRAANFILQSCDLLICVGTRLDLAQVAFDYKNFAPKAIKLLVDIDLAELNKYEDLVPAILLHMDAKAFLQDLINLETHINMDWKQVSKWTNRCDELKEKYPLRNDYLKVHGLNSRTLSLYEFIEEISPWLKDKTVVLGSSGTIAEVFFQAVHMPRNCRVINTPGLGSMGFALPAAIGAYYATGKPIVCIDGDGSVAMNIQELTHISKNQLPITLIIINNDGYVSIRNTQNNICEGNQLGSGPDNGLDLPNYKTIAAGFGLPYQLISDMWNVSAIELHKYSYVYEVMVDPNHQTVCRTQTTKDAEGNLKASGLENLWPFLPKDEIQEALC